jgi:peptidoglycan/LPS O-acetylase OafA/YrhL
VPFFFTLSGSLITYLLLREVARTGTVAVWALYVRCAPRIWPLDDLLATGRMLFYWVVLPATGSTYRLE